MFYLKIITAGAAAFCQGFWPVLLFSFRPDLKHSYELIRFTTTKDSCLSDDKAPMSLASAAAAAVLLPQQQQQQFIRVLLEVRGAGRRGHVMPADV